MQCNAMQCNAMQCNAMLCYAMQCNALHCSDVQSSAVQCNAMQCNAIQYNTNKLMFQSMFYPVLPLIFLNFRHTNIIIPKPPCANGLLCLLQCKHPCLENTKMSPQNYMGGFVQA